MVVGDKEGYHLPLCVHFVLQLLDCGVAKESVQNN
jgi:hypothetical protein